jgi:Xaa-Pro dipeptidase
VDSDDLSWSERNRRWGEIRWRMDMAGLDALMLWGNESKWRSGLANNRYISGRAVPGAILFPLSGEPVIWSGFPHDVTKWGAMSGGWISDVRSGQSITDDIIHTLTKYGLGTGRIGVVGFGAGRPRVIPETVPFQEFSRINNELKGAQFIDAEGLMSEVRIIKSPEEIALLQKSAELSRAMADALAESARPGVREYEVYAHMLNASLSRGGEEEMIWISSGHHPPPHAKRPPASSRKLEKGDIIVTEYHACYKGYLTGAELSVAIGEPRDEYRRIHKACADSQRAGIKAMQVGAKMLAAVQGFRETILESKVGYVECGLHGHGLASPEFPSCMYGGQRGSWQTHAYARVPEIQFAENMVFATATDLFDPEWNADTGLMMGRTILITKNGPEEMTGIPIEDEMLVVS